jgi:hypothetical protein
MPTGNHGELLRYILKTGGKTQFHIFIPKTIGNKLFLIYLMELAGRNVIKK